MPRRRESSGRAGGRTYHYERESEAGDSDFWLGIAGVIYPASIETRRRPGCGDAFCWGIEGEDGNDLVRNTPTLYGLDSAKSHVGIVMRQIAISRAVSALSVVRGGASHEVE